VRAVVLRRHGPPEVLRITEVADPAPGPGQVLVRVGHVGLNFAEVLSRKGLYGWAPRLPYVLGMEAAGSIVAAGEGVHRAPGESVSVGTQSGAYAERIVVPDRLALPAPAGFTSEERAAFGVNWMTAWVGLMEMARLRPGDRVLVSPAGGGVGTAAVQIASRFGCSVVALAGSEAKLERVGRLGAGATVCYRAGGWQRALRDLGPFDVALEMVGGEVFREARDTLAPFGRIVVAGYAGLDYRRWKPWTWWRAWRGVPRMGLGRMLRGSTGMLSTHLGYLLRDPPRMQSVWDDLVGFTMEHGLHPAVGHVLPFESVVEAHRLLESRASYGKIVLRIR
jgi:NADPH:quinone reductase-like Zn-dependent oxidoreductase